MRFMRLLRAALLGMGVAFFVLLLAPVVNAASVSELTLTQVQSESLTILTFDDGATNLASGYWDTKGVKFFSNKGKAIYVSSYNRGGEATASGEYAIANDANYPNTSANDPLFIEFKNPVKSVGFYYGNGSGSETATIRVYGKNNAYLGSLTKSNVTDPVTNFVGLTASESITYISLDYGNTLLSESIDSLVFSLAPQQKTCSETDSGNNKNLKGKNTIYNPDGSVLTTAEDYCKDAQTVTEITCNGGQWDVTYEACSGKCQDGQCVAVVANTDKPDLGLYGFLYIGKDRREVKWNETITLTPADTVYGNKTPWFDIYYTQKNYGNTQAYYYYNYLSWDTTLLATEYTRQLYIGSKSEIRERVLLPQKTGTHILKINVDKTNRVNEEDETNNDFQVTVKLEGFDTPTYNLNAKPVMYQPEANQTLTNYPRQAFLSWSSVKDANNYNIEVACDVCNYPEWSSVYKFQSVTNYHTTSPLAGDNRFRVRVQGVYPDGTTGVWSDWRYFRYDTSRYADNGPRCSDVKGGNVTFLVCEDYAADHFWSGSKIYLDNFDQNGANVTLKNLSVAGAYLEKGKTYTYNVTNKPGKYIEVTYLGTGQWGRALVKVDSNTTYQDSGEYQSYNQSSCVNRWGSDGLYNLCVGKTLYHNDGWSVTNIKQNSQYVWLKIKWANRTTKQIKVRVNTIKEVDKPASDESVDFSYVKYQAKSRASIRVETNYMEAEDVTDEVETTTTTNNVVAGNNYVTFEVGVNDYPDHRDNNKTQNLNYGYVNMYTMAVENNKFKVVSVNRGQLSYRNGSYGADFEIAPGQIVDFAGFKTLTGAVNGGNSKIGTTFTAPPPYKNFGNKVDTICQTNWMDINNILISNGSESCAISLSTPYQD